MLTTFIIMKNNEGYDFQFPVSTGEPVAHACLSQPCRAPGGFKACFVYRRMSVGGVQGDRLGENRVRRVFVKTLSQTRACNEFSGWPFQAK